MGFSGRWLGVVVVVAAAFVQCTLASTAYTVGDDSGWFVPRNTTFYTNWAASKNFLVGDSLVFKFNNGSHDVAKVSKSEYDACTYANPIGSIITTGPANVTLDTAGDHYYICTFRNGGHCQGGQKLDIQVKAASTNTTTSPEAGAPVPPPPSSAPALAGVAAVSFSIFAAIVSYLLYI